MTDDPAGLTVVVKCGGVVTEQPERLAADLARLHQAGCRIVLVHGGSSDIARVSRQFGVAPRRLVGPGGVSGRYTDPDALEAVILALAGLVKPRLVGALVRHGVPALGLTGQDGGLVRATAKKPFRSMLDGRPVIVRDDRSGRIETVDAAGLDRLLAAGFLPVLSPPVFGVDGPLNVDADRLAAEVAAALEADELVLLSDVSRGAGRGRGPGLGTGPLPGAGQRAGPGDRRWHGREADRSPYRAAGRGAGQDSQRAGGEPAVSGTGRSGHRDPAGRAVGSIPTGLIDKTDKARHSGLMKATPARSLRMIRRLYLDLKRVEGGCPRHCQPAR